MARYEPDNAQTPKARNQALADLLSLGGKWHSEPNARILRVEGGWAAMSPDDVAGLEAAAKPATRKKAAKKAQKKKATKKKTAKKTTKKKARTN